MSDDTIEVPVWTSGPGMRVNREYLEPEHPHSYYNYIKNVLGKVPEEYGYHLPTVTQEQREILDSMSTEVLQYELRRRENGWAAEEMYG